MFNYYIKTFLNHFWFFHRYDTFKCRIAGAALPLSNIVYVIALVICSLLMWAK